MPGEEVSKKYPEEQQVDEELYSKQFQVENKMFYVDLKSNPNGYYLKISEKSGGRRHNVFLPAPGLHELKSAIEEALKRME